ncbi:MAG: phosphate acyltransferase PlsX [Clostridia bacterium]|nr:phosphate acyltransferase PlsX [Clostridia bacterium]MDD4686088.1 phosphate acyltransferase PlsX [Clostridia bacterium]
MKIVVDGYGGDKAPYEIVKGCVMAINEIDDLNIVITGKQKELNECLNKLNYSGDRIEIVNANTVISCDEENPAKLIRSMPDSSIVVALDILNKRNDIDALISAGSTGAILSGGILKVGRIKGVSRPGLAPSLPTKISNKSVLLIDCGANADCKPINLCHFAIMGSVYYSSMYDVEKPRVALLNVGVEEAKGNILTKDTFQMLKKMPINFVGNVEARDCLSGDYDVLVTDGFSGNLILKSIEGTISFILDNLKETIKSSFFSKLGYLFMRKSFNKLKNSLDYKQYGGSQFLGCKKPIFKAHGNSDAISILITIKQAVRVANKNTNDKIEKIISSLNIEASDLE